jgi:hypothetical protein
MPHKKNACLRFSLLENFVAMETDNARAKIKFRGPNSTDRARASSLLCHLLTRVISMETSSHVFKL